MKQKMTSDEYVKAIWVGDITPGSDEELTTAMQRLSKDYCSPYLIEKEKQDEEMLNNYKEGK